jgi:alpha-1,2-mannosyltransferase
VNHAIDVRRWLRAGAAVLLLGQLVFHAHDLAPDGLSDRAGRLKLPDFLQFYTYGTIVRTARTGSLYDPETHAGIAREVDHRLQLSGFVPNYSPAIALAFAPLSSLPFTSAMVVFTALSLLVYLGALRALGATTRAWRDPVTVGLLLLAWPTLFVTLRYGQISTLSLAVAAAGALAASRRSKLAAGLAMGLLVYKPNLLLTPVLVLLIAREWRVLCGVSIGALLEVGLSLAAVRPATMGDYLATLSSLAGRPEAVQLYPAESHSLRGFVKLLVPWTPLVSAVTIAAVPVSAWLALRVWRAHDDWRVRVSALVASAMLGSPHLLTYDLLLAALPLVLLVDWHVEQSGAVPPGAARWRLALVYFGAWPGTFIARLYGVQCSTIGLLWLLWTLGARRAGRS